MELRLSNINDDLDNKRTIHRKFESMGRHLLLVRLDVLPKKGVPFHWLLENGRKPPFDIAINSEDASIRYIKFFFQDEKIQLIDKIIKNERVQKGMPCFDISIFTEKKYQVLEYGNVEAFLKERELYLIISNIKKCQFFSLDDNNTIIFDNNGFCAGILLKHLLDEEFKELMRSELLP
jgi:hypothetical protein